MTQTILSLNLRHGGGKRVDRILERLCALSPDTLVLTEFQHGEAGDAVREGLRSAGWKSQLASAMQQRVNGVLIASRHDLEGIEPFGASPEETWSQRRFMEARVVGIRLLAVYLPPGRVKLPAWQSLLDHATSVVEEETLVMGDFNTGKHRIDEPGSTFIGSDYPSRLEAAGYRNAWNEMNPGKRDYTWFSNKGNGFRIDHAYVSPGLRERLLEAQHHHTFRNVGESDHAGLSIVLSSRAPRQTTG